MKIEDITHLSVSQIQNIWRNPRKWLREKVMKMPTLTSPQMLIGSRVHEALETHPNIRPGLLKDPIVSKCITHYSPPNIGQREVQININNEEYGLPPILGYIDLYQNSDVPVIIDYKVSRTRRYFPKAHQMKHNLQLLVYAHWALLQNPAAKGVKVGQIQFAYGNKRDVHQETMTHICRERVERFYGQLMERLKPELEEILEEFNKCGISGVTGNCEKCNKSFGPNSCEFAPVCQGKATEIEYKEFIVNTPDVTRYQLFEYFNNPDRWVKDLTVNEENDIIEEREEKIMLKLGELMAKARDKFGEIQNTWDRRETMTIAVVKKVVELNPDIILLPNHFIGGTFDPDYMPVITQLKEKNFNIAIEV